ncbi:hypothetical protein E2C01_041752 [Portunus trituberculatus]|uniref:Uncharacterized protein n=1 Tax=Portunus trituberculatus TaxID=210409 RepID=A0A5B7FK20_PORTR|nr:hypothetical protein [Portunus trituberculatus]
MNGARFSDLRLAMNDQFGQVARVNREPRHPLPAALTSIRSISRRELDPLTGGRRRQRLSCSRNSR